MVRFGIIGAGSIARKFAEDIHHTSNATLVAVASRSFEKAQAFQQEFQLELAFGSYEELVKCDAIDAVYVATPHTFHKEHTILSLNHKKHVLCEKPIAVNYQETMDMFAVAKHNERLLMEGMWTRFLPVSQYLKQRLSNPTLGQLQDIQITLGFQISEHVDESNRLLNPYLAGGSLLDLGIYPMSMLAFIADSPIIIQDAFAQFSHTNVDTAVDIYGILENAQKTTFTLRCAMNQELENSLSLHFENGSIVIPYYLQGQSIIENGTEQLFPIVGGGFEYQIEHFAKSVLNHQLEDSIMRKENTLDVMKLMDEVRRKIGLRYPFEK